MQLTVGGMSGHDDVWTQQQDEKYAPSLRSPSYPISSIPSRFQQSHILLSMITTSTTDPILLPLVGRVCPGDKWTLIGHLGRSQDTEQKAGIPSA